MKQRLESFREESSQGILSDSERHVIRQSLLDYMEQNPVRERAQPFRAHSSFSSALQKFLTIFLVLFLGFGVAAYAAERTVPGDFLYPIKRADEQVRSYLAISNASKARLDVDLANRRLTEAEELSAEARMSHATQVELAQDLNADTADFQNQMQVLTAKDATVASEVQSQFQSTLAAHAQEVPLLALDSNYAVVAGTTTSTTTGQGMHK